MKKVGIYYKLILLLTFYILWTGGYTHWKLTPFAMAQERGAISELTRAKDFELTAELEKVWDYLTRRHFHNYLASELPQDPNPSVCFVCHGSYPHQNAKMTRAILNMHTVFCSCESCHFKFDRNKDIDRYGYRWYDGSSDLQATQRHYGTKYDPVRGVVLMESEDTLFKISPFLNWENKYYMIDLRQENAWAQKMLVKREHAFTPEEQAKIKTTLHSSIETKGYECGECHMVNSIIPFGQLGFDRERVKDLTGLNIVGMVEKYQKFYIPDIFKQKTLYETPIIEDRAEK
jgi:hypothetical protein